MLSLAAAAALALYDLQQAQGGRRVLRDGEEFPQRGPQPAGRGRPPTSTRHCARSASDRRSSTAASTGAATSPSRATRAQPQPADQGGCVDEVRGEEEGVGGAGGRTAALEAPCPPGRRGDGGRRRRSYETKRRVERPQVTVLGHRYAATTTREPSRGDASFPRRPPGTTRPPAGASSPPRPRRRRVGVHGAGRRRREQLARRREHRQRGDRLDPRARFGAAERAWNGEGRSDALKLGAKIPHGYEVWRQRSEEFLQTRSFRRRKMRDVAASF